LLSALPRKLGAAILSLSDVIIKSINPRSRSTILFASKSGLHQFEFKPATKMVNFKDVKKGDYLEMAAYSIDLRQKILSAWQNKEGHKEC